MNKFDLNIFCNYSKPLSLVLFQLALFLVIFPEIGLIRLPSDAQPYFVVVMLLGIIFNLKKGYRYSVLIIPFFIILLFSTLSFFISIFNTNNFFTLFRSYFGYLSSFIVMFYLFRFRHFFSSTIIIPLLDFSVKFIYLGFILNLIGLNKVVQLLVNRAEFRFDGARGLVSFYSEQSQMVTACFVILFLYTHFKQLTFKRGFFVILAILLSASGQAFIEIMLVSFFYFISYILFVFYKLRVNRNFFKIFTLAILFLFALNYGINNLDFKFRVFEVFKNFNLDKGLYLLGSDYSITWKVQGVFLAIATLIADPFSFQISALTETHVIERLYDTHYAIYNFVFGVSYPRFGDRVYSAFGTWIVDFGIFGFSMYVLFVVLFIYNIFKNNHYHPIVMTSIFYVLYVTMIKVGLSTPTIFLVVFSTYTMALSPKNQQFIPINNNI
jgi:hypothetical protein